MWDLSKASCVLPKLLKEVTHGKPRLEATRPGPLAVKLMPLERSLARAIQSAIPLNMNVAYLESIIGVRLCTANISQDSLCGWPCATFRIRLNTIQEIRTQ